MATYRIRLLIWSFPLGFLHPDTLDNRLVATAMVIELCIRSWDAWDSKLLYKSHALTQSFNLSLKRLDGTVLPW